VCEDLSGVVGLWACGGRRRSMCLSVYTRVVLILIKFLGKAVHDQGMFFIFYFAKVIFFRSTQILWLISHFPFLLNPFPSFDIFFVFLIDLSLQYCLSPVTCD